MALIGHIIHLPRFHLPDAHHSDSFSLLRFCFGTATNKSDVPCGDPQQPEVPLASPPADTEEIKASQTSHLVNKHMVLPFIPPKFANADSNTLLKPSEYLKSICKAASKNSLSKASDVETPISTRGGAVERWSGGTLYRGRMVHRSVDNLDIQSGRGERRESCARPEGEVDPEEEELLANVAEGDGEEEGKERGAGPPPPPLSPLQKLRRTGEESAGLHLASAEPESPRTPQPLATISIQDLTSIQLRRTTAKMNATKTFSAPPPRSVSMTNVSESFFVQKTDLIAELKRTKDIPGIKKLKVEMAQVEKTQEQNLMTEISKAFNVSNFVDQIPERDSSGNVIPIWKRQMLARKAAERAKKELEEQIARENEERRQKAIPAWKRQLLAKKDTEEKRLNQMHAMPTVKVDATLSPRRDASPPPNPASPANPANPATPPNPPSRNQRHEEKPEAEEKTDANIPNHVDDDAQIIPWRAQLRKTNSKLNILD